ncbi:MAG: hypothetical protein AAGA12_03230 [Pseudomonadota bacterium]
MIRAALISLTLATSASAQTAEQQLVLSLWSEFLEKCGGFVTDPAAAFAELALQQSGLNRYETTDGKLVAHLAQNEAGNKLFSVEFQEGQAKFHVSCETGTLGLRNGIGVQSLAQTFETMIDQSPDLSLSGGDLVVTVSNGVVNQGAEPSGLQDYNFMIEGAFPSTGDVMLVEITQELFTFYLSATIEKPSQ